MQPIDSPVLGAALTKEEVAEMLGIGVNAVDVALHRTRNGVARIDFPEPDAPDGRWWSVTVEAHKRDRGLRGRNTVTVNLAGRIRRAAVDDSNTHRLAARFGVSVATVSRILNGLIHPEPTTEK